jgi:hypothetical protein
MVRYDFGTFSADIGLFSVYFSLEVEVPQIGLGVKEGRAAAASSCNSAS